MQFNRYNIYILILYFFIASIFFLFILIYLDFDINKIFNKSYLLEESLKLQDLINNNFIIFTTIYFLLYVIYVSFLPLTLPAIIITSIIFNPILGSIISTFCITLGSSIFFIFFIKSNLVSLFNLEKIRNHKIALKIKKNELISIFIFRITGGGGMPLLIQNLILFYSKVRFKNFFIGTLAGTLPGNFLISFLGIGVFEALKTFILS